MSSAFIPRHKLIFIFIDSAFFAIIVPFHDSHTLCPFLLLLWVEKQGHLAHNQHHHHHGPHIVFVYDAHGVWRQRRMLPILFIYSIITVIPSTPNSLLHFLHPRNGHFHPSFAFLLINHSQLDLLPLLFSNKLTNPLLLLHPHRRCIPGT